MLRSAEAARDTSGGHDAESVRLRAEERDSMALACIRVRLALFLKNNYRRGRRLIGDDMTNENDNELEFLDPESEACFQALQERILEELSARIATGDDPTDPAEREILSELIADAVLDVFVVRRRTTPRYRWKTP
jgi:hypothetical protein